MKLMVSVSFPFSGMMSRACYESLEALKTVNDVVVIKTRSALVSQARSAAVQKAIEEGFDQILFVDADVSFTRQALINISHLCTEHPVVTAAYESRDIPNRWCAGSWGKKPGMAPRESMIAVTNGPAKQIVDWCGAGFLCIDVNKLKDTIQSPMFRHVIIETDDNVFQECSEDIGFCIALGNAKIPILFVNIPGVEHKPMLLPEVAPVPDLRDWKLALQHATSEIEKMGLGLCGVIEQYAKVLG